MRSGVTCKTAALGWGAAPGPPGLLGGSGGQVQSQVQSESPGALETEVEASLSSGLTGSSELLLFPGLLGER